METGKRYIEGETYSRSVTANTETKIVEVIHVTTCKDGKAYVSTKFDFSNIDENDILECAAKHLIIACRNTEFRSRNVDDAISKDGMVLDPKDYIRRERATGSVDDRAVNALIKAGFSKDDAEMIVANKAKAAGIVTKLVKAADK